MSDPSKVRAPSQTSPRPTLREAKRKLTRDRLVAAATAAFEAKHYVDVTVDDISERAGTSRGTFYLYFPGKAKVLTECLQDYDQGLEELWERFERLEQVNLASLEEWLVAYVQLYERHQRLLNSLYQAEAVEAEFRTSAIERVKDTVARWRRLDAVQSLIETDEGLELRVLLFTAELERFLFLWIIQGVEVDRDKAIRKLAEHWYEVLRG